MYRFILHNVARLSTTLKSRGSAAKPNQYMVKEKSPFSILYQNFVSTAITTALCNPAFNTKSIAVGLCFCWFLINLTVCTLYDFLPGAKRACNQQFKQNCNVIINWIKP